MTDVSTLVDQLKALQAQLVGALQAEYFCDDLAPPPEAFGWGEPLLRSYFESGGDAAVEEPAPPAIAITVFSGQPGGGRVQPKVAAERYPAVDLPSIALTLKALVGGDGIAAAMRYQQSVIAAGIPDLQDGLFPPGDPLLLELAGQYQPYTKGLAVQCAGGGFAFQQVLTTCSLLPAPYYLPLTTGSLLTTCSSRLTTHGSRIASYNALPTAHVSALLTSH